ncbi:MAG: hypothetical protein ACFCUL_12900 [Flavobacteriaceae bacterium]
MNATNTNGFKGILVNGIFEYPIQPTYYLKMIVSLVNVEYDSLPRTFDELKDEYMGKLVDEGIVGSGNGSVTEDGLAYGMMGYEKEGTVIQYKTKSLAMVQKFLAVRSDGVIKSEAIFWVELSNSEMAKYAKGAYENAKEKAQRIATSIGKNIGDLIFIEDFQTKKFMEGFYYTDALDTREYRITAGFEII